MDSGGRGGEGKVHVTSAKAPKEKTRVMYAKVGILCLFRADGLNFREQKDGIVPSPFFKEMEGVGGVGDCKGWRMGLRIEYKMAFLMCEHRNLTLAPLDLAFLTRSSQIPRFRSTSLVEFIWQTATRAVPLEGLSIFDWQTPLVEENFLQHNKPIKLQFLFRGLPRELQFLIAPTATNTGLAALKSIDLQN